MPLYCYTCNECAHKFSRITQPNATGVCPECGCEASRESLNSSLIETSGNIGRKMARQSASKGNYLKQKHNIRT